MQKSLNYFVSVMFLVLGIGGLCLYFVDLAKMRWYFINTSYYILTFLVWMWVYEGCQWLKDREFSFLAFCKEYWVGLLSCLALTILVWYSVPPGYKVLSDETNLLAVSKAMFIDKTINNITMGEWIYNGWVSRNLELPLRPLLFPYTINFLHVLFGYHLQNSFMINLVFSFLFLLMAYVVLAKMVNIPSALAGILLIIAQPIYTMTVRSSGFDFLALLLDFFVIFMVSYYVKNPTKEGVSFLWLTLLLLAHTRYENVLLIPIVILFIWAWKKYKTQFLYDKAYIFASTILIFLPRFWQSILMKDKYENPPGVAVIGFEHFPGHFQTMVRSFFDFSLSLPYATFFNLFSLALFILFILGLCFDKITITNKHEKRMLLLCATVLVAINTLYLCHHAGIFDHPAQSRFFLHLIVAMSMMPFIFKYYTGYLSNRLLIIISLITFFIYHPIAVDQRYAHKLLIIRKDELVKSFLHKRGDTNVVVITDRPGQYTAEDYGAVDFNWINNPNNLTRLHHELQEHLFREILLIEERELMADGTDVRGGGQVIPEAVKLTTVYEESFNEGKYVRISQVNF